MLCYNFYLLLMLKLNIYKKNCRKLVKTKGRSKALGVFLFKAVERSCVFDKNFSDVFRLSLLFIWVHHNLRKSLFYSFFLKNQCLATWRVGSVFSFFKLTRLEIRERAHLGFLNGIRKSSW